MEEKNKENVAITEVRAALQKIFVKGGDYISLAFDLADYEKDYKKTAYYKATKMDLMTLAKNYYLYENFTAEKLGVKLQNYINNLDVSHLEGLFDKVAETYEKENSDILTQVDSLKDNFSDIVKPITKAK